MSNGRHELFALKDRKEALKSRALDVSDSRSEQTNKSIYANQRRLLSQLGRTLISQRGERRTNE